MVKVKFSIPLSSPPKLWCDNIRALALASNPSIMLRPSIYMSTIILFARRSCIRIWLLVIFSLKINVHTYILKVISTPLFILLNCLNPTCCLQDNLTNMLKHSIWYKYRAQMVYNSEHSYYYKSINSDPIQCKQLMNSNIQYTPQIYKENFNYSTIDLTLNHGHHKDAKNSHHPSITYRFNASLSC